MEGFVSHAVDVSDEVKARQELEKLNNLKDDFLAIASHDLRTPITAVKGYTQLLQRSMSKYQLMRTSGEDNLSMADREADRESEVKFLDDSLQLVSTVLTQTNRLNTLVKRLLDFTQITEGLLSLHYTEGVDLKQLALEVVGAMSLISENHHILLQPPTEATIRIECDATRLEQVLSNLIANAFKYSPPNTTVTVGLELIASTQTNQTDNEQAQEKAALLWVQDEGYGISPEQQLHIFERFYRVRNEQNSAKGGLGLGLFITAQIVEQHGGRLWVESEVGKGSTFL